MANTSKLPPAWLLRELGLVEGMFTEDGTAVIGRPDAHNSAVLNVGYGPPARITVPIREELKKRLADEGF